jgi:hypothetical protein
MSSYEGHTTLILYNNNVAGTITAQGDLTQTMDRVNEDR